MPCPHLHRIEMLYCDASPVKKLLPSDRLVSLGPCQTCGYQSCPFFLERAGTPPQPRDRNEPRIPEGRTR